KRSDNQYEPEEIITNLKEFYSGLEYGDVAEGEYQVWEFPSGTIYDVVPDREVDKQHYYTVPYTSSGTVWLPQLKKVGTDSNRVATAYHDLEQHLKSRKSMAWQRPWRTLLKRWFK